MKRLGKILGVSVVLFAGSAFAQAIHSVTPPAEAHAALPRPQVTTTKAPDNSSKRAKIEEMIQLTRADQMVSQMTGQISAQMKAALDQQNATRQMTAKQIKLTDEFQAKVQTIITDAVSWERLKPVMVSVYSDSYTEEEIDGIIAFYRSPAGQAMLDKMPQVMASTMSLVKAQTSDLQPQLEHATRQYMDAMKERELGGTDTVPSKP